MKGRKVDVSTAMANIEKDMSINMIGASHHFFVTLI